MTDDELDDIGAPSDEVRVGEAAAILGVSPGWVSALCRNGTLTARKAPVRGLPWVIKRQSVEEFLLERQVPPSDDDLDDLAKAIERDEELREDSAKQAEKSFLTKLANLAAQYGPGAVMVVGAVVAECIHPGGALSVAMISGEIRKWFGKKKPSDGE